MARAIHADAVREHVLVGWVVSQHQGKLVARMVTGSASVYVLVAETLVSCGRCCRPGWCARIVNRLTRLV